MNKRKTIKQLGLCLVILLIATACTEEFSPAPENFEDILVIEATITDELAKQKIRLTHTYSFNDLQTSPETGAEILVSDNMGNEYSFQYQVEDSIYYSTSEFKAVPGNEYTLFILTQEGKSYISTPEVLPTFNQMELSIEKKEVNGVLGAQISANSYDPTNSSHFYRYEYSETYKVIPPYWASKEAYIDEDGVVQNKLKENPEADRVCYSTETSESIMIKSTINHTEDRVENFPIRFIQENEYRLRYRYSILVKQYVESRETFQFYETLQKISGDNETILSPSQPGFVAGNIKSQNNPDEKVIGYFNVASVSSERIFLEHSVLFPDYPDPQYFDDCEVVKLDKTDLAPGGPQEGKRLLAMVSQGTWLFYKEDPINIYWMVKSVCSSCTTFASNEIPDFW